MSEAAPGKKMLGRHSSGPELPKESFVHQLSAFEMPILATGSTLTEHLHQQHGRQNSPNAASCSEQHADAPHGIALYMHMRERRKCNAGCP
jgi:hypothetical protein